MSDPRPDLPPDPPDPGGTVPPEPARSPAISPRSPAISPRGLLLGAFFVSGSAGLAYELVWSRYLALLLGHSAYAQVVVIAVYLGGMAVGAAAVGQRARSISRPLLWYARTELLLALLGLLFHPVFRAVSAVAYDRVLPAVPGALGVAVPWVLSVLLLLPPAVLLGATFPLMTGGLLRGFPSPEGKTVADAYLWNSLGGAVGVLAAGFLLVPALGTVGCLFAAAAGNLLAAAVAFRLAPSAGAAPLARGPEGQVVPVAPPERPGDAVRPAGTAGAPDPGAWSPPPDTLVGVMLGLAFFTAVASFCYEIGWIRMLSLVMGSATHSFELMLSAFILGLALGSWLVRERVDRSPAPIRLLGGVQWLMGFFALATLPLYAASFGIMAEAVGQLPGGTRGYVAFSGVRYGLALMVMLPSTVMAGATLPLVTGILLRHGVGERAVGWVYGANTFGSVTGVIAAALILLPLLGLEGLIVAAAALDMALGVALLAWGREETGEAEEPLRPAPAAAIVAVLACVVFLGLVRLDRAVLTAGVYRAGELPRPGTREVLFYEDGRTATVGVHLLPASEHMLLTTNGEPDASLTLRWLRAARGDPVEVEPMVVSDAATQTLAPLVLLAHAPEAADAVNIGHGSGMSVAALLTSPALERIVTVEIEPAMVRGSRLFLPANAAAFDDPRHRFVLDDARAFLARSGRRYDLIFSEPSNPWVSGTASLFTEEFYRRARGHLAEGGVFGQWLQLYEMDDDLVVSVLAAVHRAFPAWRAYVVGASDLLIVAGDGPLEPDWSVFGRPAVRRSLAHLPPFDAGYLDALSVLERDAAAPLLEMESVEANSDFRPLLEMGAERARFEGGRAAGTYGMAVGRFDLSAALAGRRSGPPAPYAPPPAWVVEPMRSLARTRWFMDLQAGRAELTMPPAREWRGHYFTHLLLAEHLERRIVPDDWRGWMRRVVRAEHSLHQETAGWAEPVFYAALRAFLAQVDGPPAVRASVDFLHGMAAFDWDETARALDALRAAPERYLEPSLLLDAGVVAYLATGRAADAAAHYEELAPPTARGENDLRNRLLRAHVDAALEND